jgi:hypothetical protein
MKAQQGLVAETFSSDFPLAHDSYNCISAADDGYVYYTLSSMSATEGGRVYRFNPATENIRLLGDLTTLCGEFRDNCIPQGKSHDGFYPYNNKLWFSTHVGYYEMIDGMERLPVNAPDGRGLYPGGHLLSLDPETGSVNDHVKLPDEGIVTMNLDAARGIAYLLSWPTGLLYVYYIEQNELYLAGGVAGKGEAGKPGVDYEVMCRSLLIDPNTGFLYGSTSEGRIYRFHPDTRELDYLEGHPLRRDYFGSYDSKQPGSMAYHWRKIVWNSRENCAYGVHGNSGYLFRFFPAEERLELVSRLASEPSQQLGMHDQFSYGYLGFTLDENTQTLYYLCGGPIATTGTVKASPPIAKGGARGLENLHLVTYSLPDQLYKDHGPIFYSNGERPTYVNSIALGHDGYIYFLGRKEEKGKTITDLIRIPDPVNAKV